MKKVYIVKCNNNIIWVFSSLKKAQEYCGDFEDYEIVAEDVI